MIAPVSKQEKKKTSSFIERALFQTFAFPVPTIASKIYDALPLPTNASIVQLRASETAIQDISSVSPVQGTSSAPPVQVLASAVQDPSGSQVPVVADVEEDDDIVDITSSQVPDLKKQEAANEYRKLIIKENISVTFLLAREKKLLKELATVRSKMGIERATVEKFATENGIKKKRSEILLAIRVFVIIMGIFFLSNYVYDFVAYLLLGFLIILLGFLYLFFQLFDLKEEEMKDKQSEFLRDYFSLKTKYTNGEAFFLLFELCNIIIKIFL